MVFINPIFRSITGAVVGLLLFGMGWGNSFAQKSDPVPLFELKRWNTGEPTRLADFEGGIVVLDFFAYWCVPCRQVSLDLEKEIRQHYEAVGGSRGRHPVHVLSMNIEQGQPRKTQQYINATAISFVLQDEQSQVYTQLGGRGIPFVVILDGTKAVAGEGWRIAYRQAGYEGFRTIRSVIDSVPSKDDDRKTPEPIEPSAKKIAAPFAHALETDMETMWSPDILLTDTAANYVLTHGKTEYRLGYGFGNLDLEYKPAPEKWVFWREETRIREDRYSTQGSVRHLATPSMTLLGSLGAYDGYQDYRSLWLNEFYRQEYPSGYVEAEPWGFNAGTGLRWEYRPTTAFVQINYAYQQDEIAPGYERLVFNLIRGRDLLDTHSARVTFENVLTPRLRGQTAYQITETTGREVRHSAQAGLNWAPLEHWVVRTSGGYTHEAPEFDAWFIGQTIEFDLDEHWFFGLTGRYYTDTGEIDESLWLSTAAPGLETWHVGLGIRWQSERSAFKLTVGPYYTRYEKPGSATEPFRNLFGNRDWTLLQLGFSHRF